MDIDKKIISLTTKCGKKFKCLHSDKGAYCKVESFLPCMELVVAKCPANENCNYVLNSGDAGFCACPTRIEIFRKYKK